MRERFEERWQRRRKPMSQQQATVATVLTVSEQIVVNGVSMAMLRSPLVANWKSPPFADVQLVLSRVPPFALACRMR